MAAAISGHSSARQLITTGVYEELVVVLTALELEETERNILAHLPAAHLAFALFRQALAPALPNPPKR